jgi:hypothetical protein
MLSLITKSFIIEPVGSLTGHYKDKVNVFVDLLLRCFLFEAIILMDCGMSNRLNSIQNSRKGVFYATVIPFKSTMCNYHS